MMRMRHSIWRHSAVLGGSVPLAVYCTGRPYFSEKPWATAMIVFGVYLIGVILLRATGRLESTYSDAEIASGFYQGRHREGAGNRQDGERVI
jgi:hypothetical protein